MTMFHVRRKTLLISGIIAGPLFTLSNDVLNKFKGKNKGL